MNSRARTVIISGIVILLLGAIVFPTALSEPYHTDSKPFIIYPESSDKFNETIDDYQAARENAVPFEELSDRQQRAFERALQEPSFTYSPGRGFMVNVCKDLLLICAGSGFEEHPVAPGVENSQYDVSSVISGDIGVSRDEAGLVKYTSGEVYLVQVDFSGAYMGWSILPLFEFLSKLLALAPFALFLVLREGVGEDPPNTTQFTLGYGAGLTVFVFLYPYLQMVLNAEPLAPKHIHILVGLPVLTWAVILVEVWRGRSEKGPERVQAKSA